MTLSESQAMEDFDFLGSDDNILLARFSRASFADIPEGMLQLLIKLSCDFVLHEQYGVYMHGSCTAEA